MQVPVGFAPRFILISFLRSYSNRFPFHFFMIDCLRYGAIAFLFSSLKYKGVVKVRIKAVDSSLNLALIRQISSLLCRFL